MNEQKTPDTPATRSLLTQKQIWGIILGGITGMLVGRIAGGLLVPILQTGPQIGIFLGGLLGGQIGAGNGRFGIALIMTMVLCSSLGVSIPYLWMLAQGNPIVVDRLSGLHLVSAITGIAGAMGGLMLGFRWFQHWIPQPNPSV